jgi:L-ascorbate metabolism protein UlaG (beta-lactamase superfamily)
VKPKSSFPQKITPYKSKEVFMYLQTIGHASILIRDMNHCPILLTDPWLVGSNYWRSWWMQNYPDKNLRDKLQKVPTVYITHEHPDHFHMPSIRTLGNTPQYFFPDLPETGFISYLFYRLRTQGWIEN